MVLSSFKKRKRKKIQVKKTPQKELKIIIFFPEWVSVMHVFSD